MAISVTQLFNRIRNAFPEERKYQLLLGQELTGTLELIGFHDGDAALVAVDHSADGTFVDSPMPSFAAAPGFIIIPVVDGTDGSKFRVHVIYDADEYVYYAGAEPGVGGAADVVWTRRGILLPTHL